MFSEKLLQFIWQHRYYNSENLLTTTGEKLHIIFPGKLNRHDGPDFLDARIKIDNLLFAGNVEIHLKSSDWYRHNHHNDVHYQHLILHVVFEDDLSEQDETISHTPCLELKTRISGLLLDRYNALMENLTPIPCGEGAKTVNDLIWLAWKDRLVMEKWQQKSFELNKWLSETNNSWEEIFYWLIARHFGLKVNALNFEMLARSTPLKLLAKHKHNFMQLEALLFGQAGLLERKFDEEYPAVLQKEYAFLRSKYQLKPMTGKQWKYMRLRPVNFPDVRIAQLAALIYQSSHLFSKLLELKDVEKAYAFFEVQTSDYWNNHYRLGKSSVYKTKQIGQTAINSLLINALCPILFFYGCRKDEDRYKESALEWLKNIPPEQNRILKKWEELNIINQNAIDSQALLYLKNNYCDERKCLECAIGNQLLASH